MTINEVIAQVDELRPNTCPDEVKAGWISQLDGRIAVEVLRQEAPMYPPEEWDRVLLAAAPYDGLYVHYVTAMVEYQDQELDLYNNAMVLFNEALGDYRKWYHKTHLPLGAGGYVGVM